MSYEYNPASSRFEVPNPHRIENLFLLGAAAICGGLGISALLIARDTISAANSAPAAMSITLAAILLLFALSFAVTALRQLRFFFGRGQPAGLAPELTSEIEGTSEQAAQLRETIRQNAIRYDTPTGALDNILYSMVRDLVFSPARTQNLAKAEFHNTVGLLFLLVCFAVSMVGVSSGAVRGWVGALYFVLANVLVLLPLRAGAIKGRSLSIKMIVLLVIVAMIGPILLSRSAATTVMPIGGAVQFVPVTVTILIAALIAAGLLLKAAVSQVVRPNQIAMAQKLHTISMNAPPAQLFQEFDREMQRGWTETVPNRVYMRVPPKLGSAPAGEFEGHALEETQPMPNDLQPLTFSRCLALDTYRWLLMLDAFSLLTAAVGSGLLFHAARAGQQWGALLIGMSLLLISRFGFSGGNGLWRRFEFTSRIYWLETHGSYQRARTEIGTLLQDRVKTQKDIVNVEDMSLRLWAAEVDSVSFGPDVRRSLTSIRGLPLEAERLSAHLADFGIRQSSIIAPGSQTDLQRLAILDKINPPQGNAAALGTGIQQALIGAPTTAPVAPPAATAARFCTQCGTPASAAAAFCGQCGTRLPGPPTSP